MRTSAPGNSRPRAPGFTLIELMVVVALIAIASAVVSLSLRDPAETQLEREGARLVALLDSARTEARASGVTANWEPRPEGFRFVGLSPSSALPSNWLTAGVSAEVPGARAVLLGPEPLIGAQRIVLRLGERRLTLATDGLGPFAVVADEAPAVATLMRRVAASEGGFTLIEVLVALAIVAITLGAGIKAAGALTGNTQRLADVSAAQWCADNQLTGLRLSGLTPPIGDSELSCGELGRSYRSTLAVRPTPNPNFVRLEVQVFDDAGVSILSLATILKK